LSEAGWLVPEWSAPQHVGAVMSTRAGGVSSGPYASLNLGGHVGDDPAAVQANRSRLQARLEGAVPVFLQQVHGVQVVRLQGAAPAVAPQADASITTEPGLACTIGVADCLPVLLAAPGGVGAAHAGWRGLAGGVLERAVEALCAAANCGPRDLSAWLGPCIGPARFEVGADVLQAFGASPQAPGPRFVPAPAPDGRPRWHADLPGLARERLQALGVARVAGGAWCTVSEPSRFFSFRRDGVTGRMAAAVWLRR
jgi:YfiH family protein